jgi:hypothetical protein
MLLVTILLLAAGALLAALGTAGFYTVATTAPDPDDLGFTKHMATTGRRLIYTGLPMLAASHIGIAGPTASVLAVVGFLAAASYLTSAPLRATNGAAR